MERRSNPQRIAASVQALLQQYLRKPQEVLCCMTSMMEGNGRKATGQTNLFATCYFVGFATWWIPWKKGHNRYHWDVSSTDCQKQTFKHRNVTRNGVPWTATTCWRPCNGPRRPGAARRRCWRWFPARQMRHKPKQQANFGARTLGSGNLEVESLINCIPKSSQVV